MLSSSSGMPESPDDQRYVGDGLIDLEQADVIDAEAGGLQGLAGGLLLGEAAAGDEQGGTERSGQVDRGRGDSHVPEVVNYLRRALLDPAGPRGHLLERLTELSSTEVGQLRRTGRASVKRAESAQVIRVMIRQLGHLFLQPMLDAMWRQLAGPDAPGTDKPVLEVRVQPPDRRLATSNP